MCFYKNFFYTGHFLFFYFIFLEDYFIMRYSSIQVLLRGQNHYENKNFIIKFLLL